MLVLTDEAKRAMTARQVQMLKLYSIDYDPPNTPKYYASWKTQVLYNGNIYEPIAVKDSGIKQTSSGQIEPVTLTVGNIDGSREIQTMLEQYELIGKKVTRTRMFYGIDDPITNTFSIVGARAKKGSVTFTLSIGFDFLNSTVPNRSIYKRFCRWLKSEGFKGSECKYTGADTTCKYTYEDCKDKGNLLNFGGFPGVTNHYFYF